MTIAGWAGAFGGPEPLALLLTALFIDALIGDMPWLFRAVPHPVALAGGLTGFLERRLNRERLSEAARRALGALVAALMIGLAAAAGWFATELARALAYGWLIELALLVVLIAQRGLFDHTRAVARPLEAGDLEAARAAVSHIVGRDPAKLDRHGVARAGIESCAENFSDGVVAPVFWYVLLGLPGLFVYKTVNTMDSMIGYRSARHLAFGLAAARLDDVLNVLPARLSGLLLALAALIAPGASPRRAFQVMWRDAGKHRSPNAGWPEAAMAGALGLALAGPRHYADGRLDDPWLGDGRPRAEARDIARALFVFTVACLLNAGWVAGLLLARRVL